MSSPSARSLKNLRERGFVAESVERWIPGANIRRDLYSFFDIVAVSPTEGIFGIQVSTSDHKKSRLDKAKGLPGLIAWKTASGRIFFHGWRKLRGRWVLEEIELEMSDLIKPAEVVA